MTRTNFSILTVAMILGAFLVIPSAHALIVTPDGFTQSSGHSRYTALSSAAGRVCGLELCNLVVPNLKSSTDLNTSFERVEGKELSKEQILEKTIDGEFAQAILANYNKHKDMDVGMLIIDEDNQNVQLFANPDFVEPKPTKSTLQRDEIETEEFIVVLPGYIARYAPGYANEDFPVYIPKMLNASVSVSSSTSIGMPAVLGSNVTEMIVCVPQNVDYTNVGCDNITNGTSIELVDTVDILDIHIVNATSMPTNSTESNTRIP